MVHVKRCPNPLGRGKPSTEFYKDENPQIYCYGWVDIETESLMEICKSCADHVNRAQDDLDSYNSAMKEGEKDDKNMSLYLR